MIRSRSRNMYCNYCLLKSLRYFIALRYFICYIKIFRGMISRICIIIVICFYSSFIDFLTLICTLFKFILINNKNVDVINTNVNRYRFFVCYPMYILKMRYRRFNFNISSLQFKNIYLI